MDIGMALPTMAQHFDRSTFLDWCAGIDEGPYSSISAGERITFHNPEMLTTTTAAAALTTRVRVMTNIVVLPLHAPAMLAQQLSTIDVLSGGRLDVGVGVGGRHMDYEAVGATFAGRHAQLDQAVAELQDLWNGAPAYPGGEPIGPRCVQDGGPPIYAGTLGPKGMARAAQWAQGVTGFSISGGMDEIATVNRLAVEAWEQAGRTDRPRLINGTFFLLGGEDPAAELHAFAKTYLGWFGDRASTALADLVQVSTASRLAELLESAEAAGCDEFILVPGTVDPRCLELATKVISG